MHRSYIVENTNHNTFFRLLRDIFSFSIVYFHNFILEYVNWCHQQLFLNFEFKKKNEMKQAIFIASVHHFIEVIHFSRLLQTKLIHCFTCFQFSVLIYKYSKIINSAMTSEINLHNLLWITSCKRQFYQKWINSQNEVLNVYRSNTNMIWFDLLNHFSVKLCEFKILYT